MSACLRSKRICVAGLYLLSQEELLQASLTEPEASTKVLYAKAKVPTDKVLQAVLTVLSARTLSA